jgi:tetratricopeptide (TPR) repeat protein
VERASSYAKDDQELANWAGELRSKVLRRRLAQASKEGDEARASALEQQILEHEVQDFERHLVARPGDGQLILELCRRLLKAGRIDDALSRLQRLPEGPGLAREGALLKVRAFEKKGFLDLAVREYERAFEGLPTSDERAKEIWYTLGELALAAGRRDEARRCYSAVFEVDIQFRDVAQRMKQLR